MDKSNINTRSDPHFYKKIVNKYNVGKKKSFTCPILNFYKRSENVLSQRNNNRILIKFHIYNQNPTYFKNFQGMKELLLPSTTEKFTPKLALSPYNLKNIQCVDQIIQRVQHESVLRLLSFRHSSMNRLAAVSSIKSLFSRVENAIKRTQYAFFPTITNTTYSQSATIFSDYRQINHPRRDHTQIESQTNINNLFNTPSQNWMNLYKYPIMNHHNISSFNSHSITSQINNKQNLYANNDVSIILPKKRNTLQVNNENLVFHDPWDIEYNVDKIKKIVVETKKEVADKTTSAHSQMDMDLKQHLDINDISEQVYQLIDRKIKIETERRGIYR